MTKDDGGLVDRLRAFSDPERGWELSAGDIVDAADEIEALRRIVRDYDQTLESEWGIGVIHRFTASDLYAFAVRAMHQEDQQ